MDPVVHADTERVAIDRDALRTSGELQVDVHALRRRTLAGLAALAALSLVGALIYSPWLWVAQVLLDLAVVGYLLVLRKVARRERLAARRAARAAAREALADPSGAAERPVLRRRRATRPSRRSDLPRAAAPERAAGTGAPAAPRPRRRRPHAGSGRLAAQRRGRSGRRRHRFRRHRRVPAAPRRQRLIEPVAPGPPGAAPVAAPERRDGKLSVEGAVAQSGSAPRSHRGGQGFNSPQLHTFTVTAEPADAVGAYRPGGVRIRRRTRERSRETPRPRRRARPGPGSAGCIRGRVVARHRALVSSPTGSSGMWPDAGTAARVVIVVAVVLGVAFAVVGAPYLVRRGRAG